MEDNIIQAAKNNIIGTFNAERPISKNKIKFVYISTDKAVKPSGFWDTKGFGSNCQNLFNKTKKLDITIVRFGMYLQAMVLTLTK